MTHKVTTGQVSIGPEFFAKAKDDYSDWRWAIVREFLQNSLDAGSSVVDVRVAYDGTASTTMTVTDDGCGMSQDVLVNKLLSLGSSGKNFAGTVGGFGKAKEILYFCWEGGYSIRTGTLLLEGHGSAYTITDGQPKVKGTTSSIVIPGNRVDLIAEHVNEFCTLVQTKAKIVFNGSTMGKGLNKGAHRRDLSFGSIYSNRQHLNRLVVRVGGIPMYSRWIDYDGCIVVELPNSKSLTSNRDGLQHEPSHELDAFINDLTVNKSKALRPLNTGFYRFEGDKLRTRGYKPTAAVLTTVAAAGDVAALTALGFEADLEGLSFAVQAMAKGRYTGTDEPGVVVHNRKRSRLSNEFFVKCEYATKTALLDKYMPDNAKWSKHADTVASIWTRLIVTMHQVFEHEAEFAVGFLFSEDAKAQYERSEHGKIYFIRAAKRTFGESGKTEYLRWSTPEERADLIMSALHEFVHGLGYTNHNEEYANVLTTMAGKVLTAVDRFDWCFAAPEGGE